jgi:ABC-type lipoprotein release transport system permease subunit
VQVAIGLALGVLGAYGVGRLVEGMLVQTAPADPRVLTVVAVVLMLAALAACVVPARRAMRVDPLTILRSGRA